MCVRPGSWPVPYPTVGLPSSRFCLVSEAPCDIRRERSCKCTDSILSKGLECCTPRKHKRVFVGEQGTLEHNRPEKAMACRRSKSEVCRVDTWSTGGTTNSSCCCSVQSVSHRPYVDREPGPGITVKGKGWAFSIFPFSVLGWAPGPQCSEHVLHH